MVILTHPISKVPTRTQGSCSICLRPISKVPTRTQGGSSIGLRRISKVPTRMQGGSSIGLRRIYKVPRAAHVCIFHMVHEHDLPGTSQPQVGRQTASQPQPPASPRSAARRPASPRHQPAPSRPPTGQPAPGTTCLVRKWLISLRNGGIQPCSKRKKIFDPEKNVFRPSSQ